MFLYIFYKNISSDRLMFEIQAALPSIEGLRIDTSNAEISIYTSNELSSNDQDILSATIDSHNPSPTTSDIISSSINSAIIFGNKLMGDFIIENVELGITQAGKTIVVTTYLHKLNHYVSAGSLYAAITEMNNILADDNKDSLSPFVTNDRITTYKHRVQAYLGLTLD